MADPKPPRPPDRRLPTVKTGVSWARVVGSSSQTLPTEIPPHLQKTHFDHLKNSIQTCVSIDQDLWQQAKLSMQSSLYGKFLGKALPLDQAKLAISDAWRGLGDIKISDLPNGFYYIRCSSPTIQAKLLWEGPWTIDGRILQLSPWRESFQPAFEKLSSAAVWIQLHHVPMELWGIELLESIASHFGKVLKFDEHTLSHTRSKYARVCIDLDLDQPLQKGTWIKYGENLVFILVLYEKLPVFCFKCGRVGHGESTCTFACSRKPETDPQPPANSLEKAMEVDDQTRLSGGANNLVNVVTPVPEQLIDNTTGASEDMQDFGPWLKPRNRKGFARGRGRGGGMRSSVSARRSENDDVIADACPSACPVERHADAPSGLFAARGGRVQCGGPTSSRSSKHRPSFSGLEVFSSGPEAPFPSDTSLPVDTVLSLNPKENPATASETAWKSSDLDDLNEIPDITLPDVTPEILLSEEITPPDPIDVTVPPFTSPTFCKTLPLTSNPCNNPPLIITPSPKNSSDPRPTPCRASSSSLTQPQSQPLLLSSIFQPPTDLTHSSLVDCVKTALLASDPPDSPDDDGVGDVDDLISPRSDMEFLSESVRPDHLDAKSETSAKKAPSRSVSRLKKGRQSPY